MFGTIKQFGIDTFNWLDTFGHDHWGFILAFVFFWWLANRLLLGVWENVLFYRRGFDWMRMRSQMRMPHFERVRPNLSGTGFGQQTSTAQNSVGFTSMQSGRLDLRRFSDVELGQNISLSDLDRLNGLRGYMRSGGDGQDN